MKTEAPYGSWPSPISTELLTQGKASTTQPQYHHGYLYWLENRPWEQGRTALLRRRCQLSEDTVSGLGAIEELLPPEFSIRSKVHEYGGNAYIVANDCVYFCHAKDQQVYALQLADTTVTPVTQAPHYRFADFHFDEKRQQLLCVAEIHSGKDQPTNCIVTIPLANNAATDNASQPPHILCSGEDFYAYPRLNSTGDTLCWISWNHPNMPWDNTELWCATMDDQGLLHSTKNVAGNGQESILQPRWSPNNDLYFVSDRGNWWNLYKWDGNHDITPVLPMEAEFATPLWILGMSNYDFYDNGDICCSYTKDGQWYLADLNRKSSPSSLTPVSFTLAERPICQVEWLCCAGQSSYFIGSSTAQEATLCGWDKQTKIAHSHLAAESPNHTPITSTANQDTFSQPEAIHFATGNHKSNGERGTAEAYGFFYPPNNSQYCGSSNTLPPLIVICHGGPTGATSPALNYKIQFWTSRGFAVADVNYRGSTGYGRGYREQLHEQWGCADVEDVIACAQFLIDTERVDPSKIAIRGSSAGGLTVLLALSQSDLFKAGTCLYGVCDLLALATDTHKFELRYLDNLVGTLPKNRQRYEQRSPMNHVDSIQAPVIFFQGLEDKVVPPQQTRSMAEQLESNGIAVAYMSFTEEGHGFKKAATIEQSLLAELSFYGRAFSFEPADDSPQLDIKNAHKLNRPGV